MPPNRFESEVESFLEGSHGDRTHIKRADHPRLHHYAGRYSPTGTKLAQHTQNQQNSAILDMQGELSLAPGANPASRANFLSLIHHLGDDFRAADRHRLTVVHHRAHVAFCFFGPVSCTLKVASHGVPLQGAYTGLIRANSVHPVSTIKFPPTTTHAQIPTHPSTGQVPSGKLCTGLFGELERHTESAHS